MRISDWSSDVCSSDLCRLRLLAAGARQCRFRRRRRDMSAPQARNWPVRLALRSAAFAERWFPDAYVFAVLGVVLVAACAIGFGASPADTVGAFGEGFWSLIPFTMQMAFVVRSEEHTSEL